MAPADPPAGRSRVAAVLGVFWRLLSFVLAAAVVYVCFTQWNTWEGEARFQDTDDAYLQTNLTPLSAQVSGYIDRVPVQDYATVKAGQVIATIVDDPDRAEVA
ncbi:MAG TPA: biotin/lipoyl-binding protein, partial [Acidisoma sp.]|nr:biotin/lipoyl-binding protein [Acidisoma sp.]